MFETVAVSNFDHSNLGFGTCLNFEICQLNIITK